MPELPEVESICRQLEPLIVGKTIVGVEVLNPGSFSGENGGLVGKKIAGVGRKGKILILSLQTDLRLFVHLKMSGRLLMLPQQYASHSRGLRPRVVESQLRGSGVPADFSNEKSGPVRKNVEDKHLRVRIKFTDKSELWFIDQRKFGWMRVRGQGSEVRGQIPELPKGIDALDMGLTAKKLEKILQSSNRPIKTILLDQSKIAGIGNIYASEILWESKISPFKKGQALSQRQGLALIKSIRKILTEAIKYGGSTMDDGLYQHVGGESGNYWSQRRVYDREGEPCLRCQAPIKKGTIGQRLTYWCPNCQAA